MAAPAPVAKPVKWNQLTPDTKIMVEIVHEGKKALVEVALTIGNASWAGNTPDGTPMFGIFVQPVIKLKEADKGFYVMGSGAKAPEGSAYR